MWYVLVIQMNTERKESGRLIFSRLFSITVSNGPYALMANEWKWNKMAADVDSTQIQGRKCLFFKQ